MKARYHPIAEPLHLANGLQLKNRIVMAPMTHSASHPDGSVSDAEIKYYARRAKGAGMIVTAGATVTLKGGFPGQFAADRDELLPGLKRLARTLKTNGAKAVLQLVHAGRKLPPSCSEVISASAVADEKQGASVPREATEAEIVAIIEAFGNAARKAILAGFDGVELHGANGFLLQQFFSPHANRRNDSWGGTLERRMAFPLAVIETVKQVVKQYAEQPFLIGYRLSPEEPETPGITMADTLQFCDVLAASGLDYLHVSLNDFWSLPRRGVTDERSRITIIERRIGHRLPVIGVGGIHTAEDALLALQSGVPLIALGRELIMEPDWLEKIAEGREEEIRTTIKLGDQEALAIPDSLWKSIWAMPGWFPLEV
ncbi:UNVERIFIED_CONTAM: 2,4-dienoyl-CoA reductase-like NADH-dependent reductase (Old Yellow Enzyme family) [Brevibacillus sp. OAP136]